MVAAYLREPFVHVRAFPARLSDDWLAWRADSLWTGFWGDLKRCYDRFENDRIVPGHKLARGRYSCS